MELTLTLACGLCAAITASSLARAVRLRPARPGTWPWTVTILWACLLAACLTALGAIGLMNGIIASVVLAVVALVALRRSSSAGAQIGAGPAHLYRDAAAVAGRARRAASWRAAAAGDDDAPGGPPPGGRMPRLRPEHPAAGSRTVPLLREDPALGPAPQPAEVAASAPVPPPWDELAGWIAGYVAEDDNAQSAFLHGCAAGLVRIADAFGALSETAINDLGLDPAYGAALLEVAAAVAETAGDVALADQRYLAIYGALKQAIEDGLVLPHNARQFLGGGTAAA
jgi:hypothetical protein